MHAQLFRFYSSFFLLIFIILLIVAIVTFTTSKVPLALGGYQCETITSDYLPYDSIHAEGGDTIGLKKFEPNFQLENAAFLAILYQNISQISCNETAPKTPPQLSEMVQNINMIQFFPFRNKILICRICYTQDMDVALIYLQSWKCLSTSVNLLQTSMVPYSKEHPNIKIYSGLFSLYERKIAKELKEKLQHSNVAQFIFFGHSMGGALAYYAALDFVKTNPLEASNVFVYTFGSVRPGNNEFARYYNYKVPNTFRVVNDQDIIPGTPGSSENKPYRHVGEGIYVNFDGSQYHAHSIKDYANYLRSKLQ